MSNPIVYLNGAFVALADAKLSILDRGFMFGDGVYEVIRYVRGAAVAPQQHLKRLTRSLEAVRIPSPDVDWLAVSQQLLQHNHLSDASCYWQITRGSAWRSHLPGEQLVPTVLMMAQPAPPLDQLQEPASLSATLLPDLRWARCDIKSLMLLPNVLAKMEARDHGCQEAIFHREGIVTEGASTSLLIVHQGQLWTHPADQWILGGITRNLLIEVARQIGITCVERPFDCQTMLNAREVIIAGTTTLVAAVVEIDGRPIADGRVGPMTCSLFRGMLEMMQSR